MMPDTTLHHTQLKSLMQRSDAKGLAQLTGHGAILAATALLLTTIRGTGWLLPALFLHGVVLVFLFAALHETIHRTAFASRRLNDIVAWVCGALVLLPPHYFRVFHMTHHRFTQIPDRDPELAASKPATLGAYLWYITGLPYWNERIRTTIRHALGHINELFITRHLRSKIIWEARTLLGVYALVAIISVMLQSRMAMWYWIVPTLLGQPVLRLFLLAEHTGCPLVPDMLKNSRTTRSLWPLRRLAWNMPYHAEHHAYPALPCHALPKAHALLRDRIAVQAPGYYAVHRDMLRGLLNRRQASEI